MTDREASSLAQSYLVQQGRRVFKITPHFLGYIHIVLCQIIHHVCVKNNNYRPQNNSIVLTTNFHNYSLMTGENNGWAE